MAGEAPLDELVIANLLGELAAVTGELVTVADHLVTAADMLGKIARGFAEYAARGAQS